MRKEEKIKGFTKTVLKSDNRGLKMVKKLRNHVNKEWGKQCKRYAYGCYACDLHHALDVLEWIFT